MTDFGDLDDRDRPTMAPVLLAALAVVVVLGLLGALRLMGVFGSSEPTAEQLVRRAVVGQNDGLQRGDYGRFATYTCRMQAGTSADILAHQRDSLKQHGHRSVESVDDIHFEGNQANATATYRFQKNPDHDVKTVLTLVREGGSWKVCSPAFG